MRSVCLGVAMLIGSVVGAYAQVDKTPLVGGVGGTYFEEYCNGSDVLIGWNQSEDRSINTVAGVCQPQNNGVLVGANYGLATHGKLPTLDFGPPNEYPRCPTGQAVYGMTMGVNKYNELDTIDATCVSLEPNGGPQSQIGDTPGPNGVTEGAIGCGSGVAVGLTVRSSDLVISLGLICSQFPWHLAATPPPPTTPHYIKVIVDNADVYSDCNGTTKIGSISTTTSNQVALKELTPASCNSEFYDLSWPGAPAQDNWVFSAPQGSADGPTQLDPTTLAAAIAALKNGH